MTTLAITRHACPGLRPEPLASYLAGLGLIRVPGEQADPEATAVWEPDGLVINTAVPDLAAWLAGEYVPTPVLSPWNSGSGFGLKDKERLRALEAVLAHPSPRLAPLREAILVAREVVSKARARGWITDGATGGDKGRVVLEFRNRCPDAVLSWIDAAVVLAGDDTFFPPLLGTGGNDGRLDFSTNFHQRLRDVIGISDSDHVRSLSMARDLINGTEHEQLAGAAIGQFDPARAGLDRRGSVRRSPWSTRGDTCCSWRAPCCSRPAPPAAPACGRPGRDALHRLRFPGRIGQRRGQRGIPRRGLDAAVVPGLYAARDPPAFRRGQVFVARPPRPPGGRLLRGHPYPMRPSARAGPRSMWCARRRTWASTST